MPITRLPINEVPAYAEAEEDLRFNIPSPQLAQEVEAYARGPRHERSSTLTQETLARLKEENEAAVKEFRWENQEELKQYRFGRMLRDWEFLRMLNRIIPARFTGLGSNGLWGLEVLTPSQNGGEWVFGTGVQAGLIPEYSTMYFNRYNLPTSEMYRGWRTSLLNLLIKGLIKEEDVNKVFGEATGPCSTRYRKILYALRNS